MAVCPGGIPERCIVVVQSVLVWLAIGTASFLIARRSSWVHGIVFYLVLLVGLLRLRDASSMIMSEALSAALFLVVAALLLNPPESIAKAAIVGGIIGGLFLARPNVGAVATVLATIAWTMHRRSRSAPAFAAAFTVVVVPIWFATAPPRDPWRGLSPAFDAAALDYGWTPGADAPSGMADAVDVRRQRIWRAAHGLLGTEYYDARWSSSYRRLSELSRLSVPWLLVGAVALLVTAPRKTAATAKTLGLFLVAALVVQSLVLGALPRFALPMLPGIFVFAVASTSPFRAFGPRRWAIAGAVAVLLTISVAAEPEVLDWEWGLIEDRSVRLEQTIPRGALPKHAPATLHVRMAAPLLPTGAGVAIRTSDGATLLETLPGSERRRPFLTVPLPPSLLDLNRAEAIVLTLEATGSYDATHFLLFPVVPPPWGAPARRIGSGKLSPASGISSGGLDWWAHEGER